MVTAPIGYTSTSPFSAIFALLWMNRITDSSSIGGFVFGMQQTAVNPPAAADAHPLAMVSLYSNPGSRKCTCMSRKSGRHDLPAQFDHLRVRVR